MKEKRKATRLRRGSPEWILLLAVRSALLLIVSALEDYMGL